MTALYLLILAILAFDHHGHWSQLHPWTAWFVILVLAALIDLVVHPVSSDLAVFPRGCSGSSGEPLPLTLHPDCKARPFFRGPRK